MFRMHLGGISGGFPVQHSKIGRPWLGPERYSYKISELFARFNLLFTPSPVPPSPRPRPPVPCCPPPSRVDTRTGVLIGVPVYEPLPEREPKYLYVEEEGPVLYVVEVVLYPLFDVRVAPPAVYLCPARNARLHPVPEHVPGDILPELAYEDGSF